MYCSKCGVQLEQEAKFCSNCGNEVHKQLNKQNNIINMIQNPQNSMQNLNERYHIQSNTLNYKSVYEKVLVLANSVLYSFLLYYFSLGIGYTVIAFLLDITLMIFIVMFGGEPFAITKSVMTNFESIIPISITLFVILIVVNGIMCYLMYKNNTSSNVGFKANKLKYLLITYLFGCCGIHRFMIKDKRGGKFRLLLIGIAVLSFVIAAAFEIGIITYLSIILFGCAFGMETSDLVIALAKTPDNEKNILV